MSIFLKTILKDKSENSSDLFPFNLPIIEKFRKIQFRQPITFFVGENGSGKSTLLEAIAANAGLATAGSLDLNLDASLQAARTLGKILKFDWKKRNHRGFFLRAEDFLGYAKKLQREIKELEQEAEQIRQTITGSGQNLALGTVLAQRDALVDRYGRNLDANSHGESFLKFFKSRLVPKGLYLLDEPETPLSPRNILTLLALIKDTVGNGSQFIIATHSPILMALQPATIYCFEDGNVSESDYDNVDHVVLTRSFLRNPRSFLRHL